MRNMTPDNQPAPVPVTPELQPNTNGSARAIVIGGTALALLVAGSVYLGSRDGGTPDESNQSDDATVAECTSLSFANAAADSQKYLAGAAFPKNEVDSPEAVKKYINSLFDADGPVAGKADAASIAIAVAAVTLPAQDKKVFDSKRSIINSYDTTTAGYGGPNGVKTAVEDCVKTKKVFTEVAGYNPNWLGKGGRAILLKANRGSGNVITGFSPTNVVAAKQLGGVELTFRSSNSDNIDDFGSILIANGTNGGELYVTGTVVEPQTSKESVKQDGQKLTPAQKQEAVKTIQTDQKKTNESSGNGAGGNTPNDQPNGSTGDKPAPAAPAPRGQAPAPAAPAPRGVAPAPVAPAPGGQAPAPVAPAPGGEVAVPVAPAPGGEVAVPVAPAPRVEEPAPVVVKAPAPIVSPVPVGTPVVIVPAPAPAPTPAPAPAPSPTGSKGTEACRPYDPDFNPDGDPNCKP